MKKPLVAPVVLVVLVGAFLFAPLAMSARGHAQAQTADSVIEQHLEALGGRAALAKLTSRHSTGTITIATQGIELSGPIEVSEKAPNKSRAYMDIDLTPAGAAMTMTIDQRFNGTDGWLLNSVQGNTQISGNQLENMKNEAFPSQLLNYKQTGATAELKASEKVNGKDMVVVLLTPKAGSAVKMYLDPDTHLLARTVMTVNSPEMGGNVVQTSDVSNYRAVDGVQVPFTIVTSDMAQSITITLDSVAHNVELDDALFTNGGLPD